VVLTQTAGEQPLRDGVTRLGVTCVRQALGQLGGERSEDVLQRD